MDVIPASAPGLGVRGSGCCEPPLYFLHIPKTGGTALRAAVSPQFHAARICPYRTMDEVVARSPAELGSYDFFAGHFGRLLFDLLPKRPTVVTMLRDPVARTVSHFQDLTLRTGTWLNDWVRGRTLEEFLFDPSASTDVLNHQTRFLALESIRRDFCENPRECPKDPGPLIERFTDHRLAERAMEFLDSIAFVGIQERLDESLVALAGATGRPVPAPPFLLNASPKPSHDWEISAAARERIDVLTALDRRVYEHARSLLADRLRSLPSACEVHAAGMARLPRVREVSYGFERPLHGRGWHGRELGADGRMRRWTGPGAVATLDLPLATDRALRLRFCAGALSADILPGVRIVCGGEVLPHRGGPASGEHWSPWDFEAVLPRSVLARENAFTRLEFHVPETVDPGRRGGPDDCRRLGLYFHRLDIFADAP